MGDHHKSDIGKRKAKYARQFEKTARNKRRRLERLKARKNFRRKDVQAH